MATAGLVWSPEFAELKQALKTMSADFATEADHYAEAAAQGAAVAVRQVYAQHWVSGHLQAGVYASRFTRNKLAVGWEVKARAPHTWLFEHTSKPRFYVTKAGKIHATGRMWKGSPPAQTFIPTAVRFRREMYENDKRMLERAGLLVSGDA